MGIEPTHSHLRCDALPVELPSPWEQDGGEEGYTSADSSCPLHWMLSFSYGTPLGDDAVTYGTQLDALLANGYLMSWA